MKAKLIEENLNDILKPKNVYNNFYYIKNFEHIICFIFKIISITDISITDYIQCEVIYNNYKIEGQDFFELEPGLKFYIDKNDFENLEIKEFNESNKNKEIDNIDNEIKQLEKNKDFLKKLKIKN